MSSGQGNFGPIPPATVETKVVRLQCELAVAQANAKYFENLATTWKAESERQTRDRIQTEDQLWALQETHAKLVKESKGKLSPTCPLCMEPFGPDLTPFCPPCGHLICTEDMATVKSAFVPRCPVCRKNFQPTQVHQVFL